jgi:hypothetical protein
MPNSIQRGSAIGPPNRASRNRYARCRFTLGDHFRHGGRDGKWKRRSLRINDQRRALRYGVIQHATSHVSGGVLFETTHHARHDVLIVARGNGRNRHEWFVASKILERGRATSANQDGE